MHNYQSVGFALRTHRMALLRDKLDGLRLRLPRSSQLEWMRDGTTARTCNLVTLRQQPDAAKGTTVVSLEHKEGEVQGICWPAVREAHERVLPKSRLLAVEGRRQSRDGVTALVAHKLRDLTPLLGKLARSAGSRDFR